MDKLPIKDDILKPKVKGNMKELEKVPVPSKPEIYIPTMADKLNDAKKFFLENFPDILKTVLVGNPIKLIIVGIILLLFTLFSLHII